MSYNSSTGIISAPVSIADVKSALGASSNDLATLCKHANINKWAKYKPISVGIIRRLVYSEITNAKFGLTPAQNALLKQYSDGSTGTAVANSTILENILNANADWEYNRPSGGTSSPYRLTDFYAPADNDSSYGYYHDTPQPLSNVSDWSINLSQIRSCANASIGYTSGTESWIVNDTTGAPEYDNLSFRFGESSYDNIGGMDVKAIALNDLLGLLKSSEYWRLAIALQVPIGGAWQTMRFFSSRSSFLNAHGQSNAAALVLPSISTNQTLCSYIDEYATYLKTLSGTDIIGNTKTSPSNPTFNIPACICLIKGMYLDRDGGTKNHCKLSTNSSVYSTPSSMSRFKIEVTDDVNYSGDEVNANKLASIINESTGQYAQMGEETWKRQEIRNVVLKQKAIASSGTVVYYRVTYSYVTGYNGNTPITTTTTVSGNKTLSTSASSFVNFNIAGGPGLSIGSSKLSLSPII